MKTVYKKSGKSLEVNDDMLPHLDSLGLSLENPKKEAKKPAQKNYKPAVKKPKAKKA